MFEKRKAAKAAAETELLRSTLTAMIAIGEGRSSPETPLRLGPRERAVYTIDRAGLFETRRGPGQWSGRSSGVSVPVGLGIRVRTGQSRGHYVQGAESPTVIDTGTVTFTNQRVVFLGNKYTRVWDFSKLLGVEHNTSAKQTAIQVSNREKTSGFTYPALRPDLIAAWLELAIALGNGEQSEALAHLKQQLQAVAPPPPLAVAPSAESPAAAPSPEGTEATWPIGADPSAPAQPPMAAEPPVAVEAPPAADPASPAEPPVAAEASAAIEPASAAEPPVAAEAAAAPGTPPRLEANPSVSDPTEQQALPRKAWYPDPWRTRRLRWWDGTEWTGYTAD